MAKVSPAELVATPARLVLAPTYVGQRTAAVVDIANLGGAKAVADVSIAAPFTADTSHLELVRGESAAIEVAFAPTASGPASAVLRVSEFEVQVDRRAAHTPGHAAPRLDWRGHLGVQRLARPSGEAARVPPSGGAPLLAHRPP
ncbi:MAG: hypothetical protein ACYC8T_36530 [Myxococcaceae bacterium]